MIGKLGRLGDRLLGSFVPEIRAQASGVGSNAQIFCYCRNRQARYRPCASCGCNLVLDC